MTTDLQLFQPKPGAAYSLEIAAELTNTTRRAILVYYRKGLIQPLFLPPHGVMAFDEEAIHAIRKIEALRQSQGVNLAGIRIIFELLQEIDWLRAELDFRRQS